MTFNIVTLFPEMFTSVLSTSILKRAIGTKAIDVRFISIREFSQDKHHRVDAPPIGGGAGLLMKMQPIVDALASIPYKGHTVLLSPRGQRFDQNKAIDFSKRDHLTLVCGHYEGFDERLYSHVDETISIGDFILSGGEIAAMVILDAVMRLLSGVIDEASPLEESFMNGLLEYPQYTEPYDFDGEKVPNILYSGHHEAIRTWRLKQSLRLTKRHRPDLLANIPLTKLMKQLLKELEDDVTGSWELRAIEKGRNVKK
jgi:tRNA (guanine37-N1)-methyltransferase